MLQLARAFCTIANDGLSIIPKIVLSEKKSEQKRIYSPEVIQELKNILQKTVRVGTARRARIPGVQVFAKTGTANLIVDGKYHTDKNIFTCAGIVQHGDYSRVIVTSIKNAKSDRQLYASIVAAPLFKNIAQQMLVAERVLVT